MNRLEHFLRAKTRYNIHSPFLYRLYTEVLFAHAGGHRSHSFSDIAWRLRRYYSLPDGNPPYSTPDGTFLLVDHPHRNKSRWQQLVDDPEWQLTLDLFDTGIAVRNPRLSKQHFILR